MLIKEGHPNSTAFFENKYKLEHLMIITLLLYVISCMTDTFMNAFYEALANALKKPGVVPHPSWNTLPLFNQLEFIFGKCGSWEGIRVCTRLTRISKGWPSGDGSGPGRSVKGV